MQDHRKLRVWRHAHELALAIRRVARHFPRTRHASLYSQITRAAESIVFTIVEGCGTKSQREFARFLDMSIKSTLEVEAQLELAKDYGIMSTANWSAITNLTIDVRRMLCGLRAKVLASAAMTNQSAAHEDRAQLAQEREAVQPVVRTSRGRNNAKRSTPDPQR